MRILKDPESFTMRTRVFGRIGRNVEHANLLSSGDFA